MTESISEEAKPPVLTPLQTTLHEDVELLEGAPLGVGELAELSPTKSTKTSASSRGSSGRSSKSTASRKKASKPKKEEPKPPAVPGHEEIIKGLRDIGKRADGIGQAYLTFELHNHPGTRTCQWLTKHNQLQKVLLSNNVVEDASALGHLRRLTYLDLSHNKLEQVLDIEPATPLLRYADLSHNNIAGIRQLPAADFYCLSELRLDHNQLTAITGLQEILTLKVLSLCNNKLTAVTGLEKMKLQELYLTDNEISSLEPLASNSGLRVLRANRNRLTHIKGLEDQFMLAKLDVSENQIETLERLKPLQHLRMLMELNLQENSMLTITDAALHILHILPTLTRLNGKEVTSSSKVFSSNMHGDDYFATRQIRTRYFPNGELDDGGEALPPPCVMLPGSAGTEAHEHPRAELDAFAESSASTQAALEAETMEALGEYFRTKAHNELDLLRICYIWMVKHGAPKPEGALGGDETGPVLIPELAEFEARFAPTDKGPESGIWAERITKLFTLMLKAAHLEAEEVVGYWAPKELIPPETLPLIAPNSMWTAVFIHRKWRVVDIQAAVSQGATDGPLTSFFSPPDHFIKSHLPLSARWQLLPSVMVVDEFWPLVTEAAMVATAERAAAAAAAAEQLETETREAATRELVAAGVAASLEEDRLERELPLQLVANAIAKAIAAEEAELAAAGP